MFVVEAGGGIAAAAPSSAGFQTFGSIVRKSRCPGCWTSPRGSSTPGGEGRRLRPSDAPKEQQLKR